METEKPIFSDARRDLIVPGDDQKTIHYCSEHFLMLVEEAIAQRNQCTIALSGGNTPKAIFKALTQSDRTKKIDWSRVFLFWSDERDVPPDHKDSNYHMAMEAGFAQLAIPEDHIFRMVAEKDIEDNANVYEASIKKVIPDCRFDLVMLGLGNDGHTASLFPYTKALDVIDRLVATNHIPQKECWRMTLTFPIINNARHICFYVIGSDKADILNLVLKGAHHPHRLPAQNVGTCANRALWIADANAAASFEGLHPIRIKLRE